MRRMTFVMKHFKSSKTNLTQHDVSVELDENFLRKRAKYEVLRWSGYHREARGSPYNHPRYIRGYAA